MALFSGQRLGPYEVVGSLGAGGMGEVYRARDTALNRDVAIKVLPEAFAINPEQLTRCGSGRSIIQTRGDRERGRRVPSVLVA
ncbi:MAG: hypothetical protein M3468_07715 [Acidobacteriota bacterium]|nr:hypothetical protein [Acidobacteriota bacterium]